MPTETPRLNARVFNAADFTTFVKKESKAATDESFQLVMKDIEDGEKMRYEDSLELRHSTNAVTGRSLVCSCYAGKYLSVTFRGKKQDWAKKITTSRASADSLKSGYSDPSQDQPDKNKPNEYAFPMGLLCDELTKLVYESEGDAGATGAILITGGTGSGKTQVACGLIYRYLNKLRVKPGDRRPHLVTIEKPIEAWLTKDEDPKTAQSWGVDYTPRLIGIDVKTRRGGLEDALRQTPAVVYLGELRRDEELEDLLWFAGTGHRVVATAHAGSLVDSMDKLFRQGIADTAARRQQTGQVLSAVIHLRSDSTGTTTFNLPALWKRTPAGLDALVADGLASLLPNNPSEGHECNTFGRLYFAERLLEKRQKMNRPLSKKIETAISNRALRWDLEGM